jgi:ADP-heptose:LPS heptosyltransferase
MLRKIIRKITPNPLELILKKASKKNAKTCLIVWNRGMGDIALGLYALVFRINQVLPDVKVTFLTREDLIQGFELLGSVRIITSKKMKRGDPVDITSILSSIGEACDKYDLIIERPDPTYWCKWQLGRLVPRLTWKTDWDSLCDSFSLSREGKYLGVHIQTETSYGYEKNWPMDKFLELFHRLVLLYNRKIILFGHSENQSIPLEGVVDLRGKTDLKQMLSIIKNRCDCLLVPDSGVLSLTFYLDADFPLKIVSMWADPNQGVLKQGVLSPNRALEHLPIKAHDRDMVNISIDDVLQAVIISK